MFTVALWGTDSAALIAAARAARDSVRLVDSLMSIYRATSELSAINREAGRRPVRVSPQTLAVLDLASRYWRLSDGAFDPTVGPLVAAWGFTSDHPRVPTTRQLDSLRALVGFGAVEVDRRAGTVRLPRAGMSLDLGGVAKGFALDLARAAVRRPGISSGMLDLGGNVLVFGRAPGCESRTGVCRWRIGIVHPRDENRLLGTLEVDSGAIATSGDYEHFFTIGGVRYAHLISPRTGKPARGILSGTAVGPRGDWSDGLSAALFLAGPARGVPLADSLAGVAAIYVLDRGGNTVRRADVVVSSRAREWFTIEPSIR